MGEWFARHRKGLSLSVGALLVVAAPAMLFWYEPKPGISLEEARAQANLARMEASVHGAGGAVKKEQSTPSEIMSAYQERQERHLRYAVIVMALCGTAFLLYGFFKKEEEAET